MMVDSVSEVKYLSEKEVESLPSSVTSSHESSFLKGVGKLPDGLMILIDLNKVLKEEELSSVAQKS